MADACTQHHGRGEPQGDTCPAPPQIQGGSFVLCGGENRRLDAVPGRFEVVDVPFGWFGVDLELTLVPGNVDLALELELIQDSDGAYVGGVDWADQAGDGGNEVLSYGGIPGLDDGGIYEAIVEPVSGFDCATPYTLIITASG